MDSSYKRPAAIIRILGPDDQVIDVIEVPELVIEHPFDESATQSDSLPFAQSASKP
jgi:hypothetical protein